MLAAPNFKALDDAERTILELLGDGPACAVAYPGWDGVYVIQHFNFDHMIEIPGEELMIGDDRRWDYQYPEFPAEYHRATPPDWRYAEEDTHGCFNCYGVCDSPDQFLKMVGELLKADARTFTVAFTYVPKSAEKHGWRWHKWGPYIGTGKPTMEYLNDEEGFADGVWTYHVYQIGGELWHSDATLRIRKAMEAEKHGA